ncbi:MAG TPA: zinc-ribbon domain-containing protein, partial [Gemmatimonadaceae bacterium]
MNVGCPECGTVFRVDPAKVPLAGIRARCSVCGGVIAIGESGRIDDDFADARGSSGAPRASGGMALGSSARSATTGVMPRVVPPVATSHAGVAPMPLATPRAPERSLATSHGAWPPVTQPLQSVG